jgi:predicted dehydrogenase
MKINRRTLLKTLSGVPVIGLLGFSASKKWKFELEKELEKANGGIAQRLGLGEFELPQIFHPASQKGDVIRIGVIGFGSRAQQLARSMGFVHQSAVDRMVENGSLESWLQQEDLNIAITGVCDVFDLHAETGLAIAQNEVRPGGNPIKLPVKRYRHYQEMLADKDIDAVIIATPDHHHARITVDAAKAGKHIYCEKAVALTEDELNEAYRAVKNSKIVYQLGHQNTKSVAFQRAKEVIDRNILGKITLVETTSNRNTANGAWIRHLDGQNRPKPGDESSIDWKQWLGDRPHQPFSIDRFYNWTKWFDYASGLISQLFTHEYDMVNQLMNIGIPASAVSSGGLYFWKDNREMADLLNCVFEYPDRELSLVYSASLASSRNRGRIFMGHDGSMDVGGSVTLSIDNNSTQYKEQLSQGQFKTRTVSLGSDAGIDATTSATEMYYASRGLINTRVDGRNFDITHLHIKEWLECIRNGGEPSANIEKAYEEGVTCIMAQISYVEKRRVEWDPIKKKIV